MSVIRVNIDKENNSIRVFNNGRGIPVVEHKEEKVLVPTLIFGHLLTSSNYNDDEKKVTGNKRMTFMVIDLNFLKDANLTTVILSYLNREYDLLLL